MKKTIFILAITFLISSCGVSGRVCGGSGGKRCVEISTKKQIEKNS
jgi:hypothetical protein